MKKALNTQLIFINLLVSAVICFSLIGAMLYYSDTLKNSLYNDSLEKLKEISNQNVTILNTQIDGQIDSMTEVAARIAVPTDWNIDYTIFTLNKVMLFGASKTEIKIISAEADKIRDAILSRVDRGVTLLHGEGGYLHHQTEVILSIVSNHELPKIEALARSIDPESFIIVSQVTEVWGRGFSAGKEYHPERPE